MLSLGRTLTKGRFSLGLIGAAAALLSSALVPASQATELADGPAVKAPPPGAPIDGPAHRLASQINELAGTPDYRPVFAGITLEPGADGPDGTDRLIISVTDPSRGAQLARAAVARLGPADRAKAAFSIRRSKYSFAQLAAARAELWKVASTWKRSGVEVYMIAIPFDGSSVQVSTNRPTAAATLARTASPRYVGIVASTDVRFDLGRPIVPYSRVADTPPYNGAAYLNLSNGAPHCTAGFGMDSPGGRHLVTAGHCFRLGESAYNNGRWVGRVGGRSALRDASALSSEGGHLIGWSGVFTNGLTDEYTHYAHAEDSFANWEVCQSGRTTFYRCGIFVTRNAQWDIAGFGRVDGLEGCTRDGSRAGRPGDSGGPVFSWLPDGRVVSRGIVSGPGAAPGFRLDCLTWPQTNGILAVFGGRLVTR